MRKLFISALMFLTISANSFSQTPTYEVYALKYATIGHPFPLKYLVLNAPLKDSMNAIFMFGSLEEIMLKYFGRCRFLQDVEEAKDYDVLNYVRTDSMLSEVGLQGAEITDVILTHPH